MFKPLTIESVSQRQPAKQRIKRAKVLEPPQFLANESIHIDLLSVSQPQKSKHFKFILSTTKIDRHLTAYR